MKFMNEGECGRESDHTHNRVTKPLNQRHLYMSTNIKRIGHLLLLYWFSVKSYIINAVTANGQLALVCANATFLLAQLDLF